LGVTRRSIDVKVAILVYQEKVTGGVRKRT